MFSFSDGNTVLSKKKSSKNKKVDIDFIIDNTINNPNKSIIETMRFTIKNMVFEGYDFAQIKSKILPLKRKLNYFLYSGFCEYGHNNNDIEYNSFIHLDIDFKFKDGDGLAIEIKEGLKEFDFIAMVAISPSGYGLRVLAKTSNFDKSKHSDILRNMSILISDKLGFENRYIDRLGCSHPSFETYDKNPYYNIDYSDFECTDIAKENEVIVNDNFVPKLDISDIDVDFNEFDIGVNYATQKTGSGFENGNKYNFVNKLSIALNLLGVDIRLSRQFIRRNYYHDDFFNNRCNALESPYFKYKRLFGKWRYKSKELKSTLKITIKTYLAKNVHDISIKNKLVNSLRNAILIAPTGTGKTYWISHLKHKRIIIVPTAKMVEQVEKVYKATPFYAAKKGDIIHSDYIVTTYSSFLYVTEILENKGIVNEYVCYVDECHNWTLSTSRNFQLKQLTSVVNLLPKYRYWLAVTATDIYNFHPYFCDVKRYQIIIKKDTKDCVFINAKSPVKTMCDMVETSIKKGRFPLVLFNNTSDTGQLHTVKKILDHIPNIAFFNSKTKDHIWFKELSKTSEINPNIKGIISTTVIKEGNDINNQYDFDIITLGNFHPIELEQFYNRPRKPKSVKTYIIRGLDKEKSINDSSFSFNPYRYSQILENQCNNRVLELNNYEPYCYEDELEKERFAMNSITYLPLQNLPNSIYYGIDWLNFNNHVFERERALICSNDNLMKKRLLEFNIKVVNTIDISNEINSELTNTLRIEKHGLKAKKQRDFDEIIESINTNGVDLSEITNFELDTAKKITSIEKSVYKKYIYLRDCNLKQSQCVDLLNHVGLSKAKFSKLKRQITVYQLKQSTEYMNSNRRFSIVLKSIFNRFIEGEVIDIETMKMRLKICLSIDKSFDVSIFDKDKTNKRLLSVVGLFFSIDRFRNRDNKERSYKYRITGIDFNIDLSDILPSPYSDEYMKNEIAKMLK